MNDPIINVEFHKSTLSYLEKYATGFNATPESAVLSLIAAVKSGGGDGSASVQGVTPFEPNAPPNLAFSVVRKVVLNGVVLPPNKTNWNAVLIQSASYAANAGANPDAILEAAVVNMVKGMKSNNGYKFVPSAGISIQGQDANGAWKQIATLCTKFGIKVDLEFQWQDTPKASTPNGRGKFSIHP